MKNASKTPGSWPTPWSASAGPTTRRSSPYSRPWISPSDVKSATPPRSPNRSTCSAAKGPPTTSPRSIFKLGSRDAHARRSRLAGSSSEAAERVMEPGRRRRDGHSKATSATSSPHREETGRVHRPIGLCLPHAPHIQHLRSPRVRLRQPQCDALDIGIASVRLGAWTKPQGGRGRPRRRYHRGKEAAERPVEDGEPLATSSVPGRKARLAMQRLQLLEHELGASQMNRAAATRVQSSSEK